MDMSKLFTKTVQVWCVVMLLSKNLVFFVLFSQLLRATNFGAKSHSIPMKATGSMTKNAKVLSMQDSLKAAQLNSEALSNVVKPNQKWSDLPCSGHINPFALGLVHSILDRQDLYSVRRISQREFEVACSICVEPFTEDPRITEQCPIPRFNRIRRVVVDDDGTCHCSCCYFQQVGIPCPHMAQVFEALHASTRKSWDGFLHTDVSLRWWNAYNYYAYRFPGHGNLTRLFHRLRQNDVTGPKLPIDLLTHTVMSVEAPTPEISAIYRLKNYKQSDISEYLGGTVDGCRVTTYVPESLLAQLGIERAMLQSDEEETTQDDDHVAFSQSLEEYEFEADGSSSMPAGVNTRSALNPLYQEACNHCDRNPQLKKLLAEALEGVIQQGRQLENEKLPTSERNGKTVSMSTSTYKGPPRVYNTKHYM